MMSSKKMRFGLLVVGILVVFLMMPSTPPPEVKAIVMQSLRSEQVTVSRSSGVFAGEFENQTGREKWRAILEAGRIETERIVPGAAEGEVKYETKDASVILIFYPGTYQAKGPYVVARVSGKASGNLVLKIARDQLPQSPKS